MCIYYAITTSLILQHRHKQSCVLWHTCSRIHIRSIRIRHTDTKVHKGIATHIQCAQTQRIATIAMYRPDRELAKPDWYVCDPYCH